mgnify:CR=1 FL=1
MTVNSGPILPPLGPSFDREREKPCPRRQGFLTDFVVKYQVVIIGNAATVVHLALALRRVKAVNVELVAWSLLSILYKNRTMCSSSRYRLPTFNARNSVPKTLKPRFS